VRQRHIQGCTEIGSNAMTDREIMILGKLILTFGCLLGLPIWELWKLRRWESDQAEVAADEETASPER
jgi:hypothetical protein